MRVQFDDRGNIVVATATIGGETKTLVTDPANETRPVVELKTWVADTGGAAPPRDDPKGKPCR